MTGFAGFSPASSARLKDWRPPGLPWEASPLRAHGGVQNPARLSLSVTPSVT